MEHYSRRTLQFQCGLAEAPEVQSNTQDPQDKGAKVTHCVFLMGGLSDLWGDDYIPQPPPAPELIRFAPVTQRCSMYWLCILTRTFNFLHHTTLKMLVELN